MATVARILHHWPLVCRRHLRSGRAYVPFIHYQLSDALVFLSCLGGSALRGLRYRIVTPGF